MKVITISKKKYDSLKEVNLSPEIFNTEGIIKNFEYKRQPKVVKSLNCNDGEEFGTKLYTIEMLDANKEYLPNTFYIPDYLLSVNNRIVGFTIPYVSGINLATVLKSNSFSIKEQIYYLKKIGELLEQLKNIREYTPLKSIYINDLHDSNFIVNPNNKTLNVIDLDSCKIGTNNSFIARFLTPFSLLNNAQGNKYIINDGTKGPGHVIANNESDLYCYIIIILNYLLGNSVGSISLDDFYTYLNYLDFIGIDNELLRIFEKIVLSCPNENPVNYLDTLTTSQIVNSRKDVYKLSKSKITR